ncbi:MAG: hypothetical protein FRX49_09160 [Trebouxia sp. A1-2]|nr:MAG: hypothetical protein FRX49_09160 [Trebouxia sp. A1-2]
MTADLRIKGNASQQCKRDIEEGTQAEIVPTGNVQLPVGLAEVSDTCLVLFGLEAQPPAPACDCFPARSQPAEPEYHVAAELAAPSDALLA